jgi:hypothetical protein
VDDPGNPSGEGAAPGSNPTPTGAETHGAPTPGAGTSTPAFDSAAWEKRFQDQQSHIDELKRQYNGATQEALRQKERADAQQKDQADLQRRLLMAAGVDTSQPAPPTYRTEEEAQEAWMSGRDPQALTRFRQAEHLRLLDTAKQQFGADVQKVVEPRDYAAQIVERYPELSKADTPEYKAVLETYAKLADDPLTQRFYPKEGAIVFNGYDLRLVEKAVLMDRAARGASAERTNRPTVLGGESQAPAPAEDANRPLMSPEERAFIGANLTALKAAGWGSTEADIIKHRWEKVMSADEKKRRQALHAKGQWEVR